VAAVTAAVRDQPGQQSLRPIGPPRPAPRFGGSATWPVPGSAAWR
jgi:hypothetical protein